MFCKKCGAEIPDSAATCPACGALRDGLKFCQHCGAAIDKECIICPACGKQVSQVKQEQPQVVINNTNTNANANMNVNMNAGHGRPKNKWVAFLLCLFLGGLGAHKFYEGKAGTGILYILTVGIFGIGWLIDLINLLFKPNPYYV